MIALLRLFWSFFQVGIFTIGGGYASLPIVQEQVIKNDWMSMTEFTDLLTISQMTPGPVAINLATFVGLRYEGIAGGIVATVAYTLPSFIIVSVLAVLYRKYSELRPVQNALSGIRPATIGLIFSAGLSIVWMSFFGVGVSFGAIGGVDFIAVCIFAAGFVVLRVFKPSPLLLIAGSGVLGGVIYTIFCCN
ncbi:MAG: chromate transporter [Clostridiales Family XIII bacterium]|jgi:chromate transporter|nr:chromate transporter [Clostridiales Family XIII bacterium]